MRITIQRVKEAAVVVDNVTVGKIGKGLLLLVGFNRRDTKEEVHVMVERVLRLKLFNEQGKLCSVVDGGWELLCVSQFTLYHLFKGTKPDFHLAMKNEDANEMFEYFKNYAGQLYDMDKIQSGKFGEFMHISAVNEGPSFWISDEPKLVKSLEELTNEDIESIKERKKKEKAERKEKSNKSNI